MPQLRRGLGGILVWACPSVCRLCVTFALGQEPLKSRNLVCKMSMKIKRPVFFSLSIGLVIAELLPFSFFFLHYKPMEACEQNITRTA